MPVPEGEIELEKTIEQSFDISGETMDGFRCDKCRQKISIRKIFSMTDPKKEKPFKKSFQAYYNSIL